MSSKGQQRRASEDETNYIPKTTLKSVVIQRGSSGPSRMRSSGGYSSGFSGRSSGFANLSPSVYSKISSTGIDGFRNTRETEKREMQGLNERLATYIEKVRWLEAECKRLNAENEALRNRKQEDWKPIRDMYESELEQCRRVIEELSKDKGVSEAKLAGFQDEIRSQKDYIIALENQAKDYIKKIDQLNSQIGEYEGELTTLRLRVGSLEDDNNKLRDLIQRLKAELAQVRADLDAETAAHIEQEVRASALEEKVQFLEELLDKLEMMKQEPVTIGGQNLESFYKGEIKACVRDIQAAYEQQCDAFKADLEMRMDAQMNQLRSGNVRDTMEVEHAREESKRLKESLAEARKRIADLEQMLAALRVQYEESQRQLDAKTQDYEELQMSMDKKVNELQMQIEALMAQLSELIDAKMSLELEIACYKKLLEGEENRTGLRQLVEQTVGVRGSGAGQLADLIGQSTMQSTTARTMVQRSAKGPIGFKEIDPSGAFCKIENTGTGSRAKVQNLAGFKLIREVNGDVKTKIDLPDFDLRPGKALTIFAKGAKSETKDPDEVICNEFSLGNGPCFWKLLDNSQQEKATLSIRMTQ